MNFRIFLIVEFSNYIYEIFFCFYVFKISVEKGH